MEENTSTRNTPSKLRKLFVSDVFDPESGMLLGGMNLFASACLFIMSLPLLIVSIERLNANFEPCKKNVPFHILDTLNLILKNKIVSSTFSIRLYSYCIPHGKHILWTVISAIYLGNTHGKQKKNPKLISIEN